MDGRKTTELLNVVDGRMYIPARGGHPKKAVVFDDIYYGYLIWKAYSRSPPHLAPHQRDGTAQKPVCTDCSALPLSL